MTPPSIAVIAATLLTADLGWQQLFRNAVSSVHCPPFSKEDRRHVAGVLVGTAPSVE